MKAPNVITAHGMEARPAPELPSGGTWDQVRQAKAFQADWKGFLARAAAKTGASAFRMHLGGPLVAVIDGVGVRATRDPERFARIYGFGPRRPSRRVIGTTVPTIFTDGALHERRKQAHLALYRAAWPALDAVTDRVLEDALPRWETGAVTALGAELERIMGRILFLWLLDAEPPMADVRRVGNGVIPFRPTDAIPMPGDRAVRAAFERLARFIAAKGGRRLAEVANRFELGAPELARDLAFVLPMNAWAAMSGATVSAMAELSRNPEHRERIADDPRWAEPVLREVLRLHPPAPVVFTDARADGPLPTREGPILLRAGDRVMGVLAMAHRDPRVFTDPDAFRPERFDQPGLADEVLWSGGPDGAAPTPSDRVCPGRSAVYKVIERVLVAIARGRWALARRPEWGAGLTPRNVPSTPLELVAYRRGPAGLPWTVRRRAPSLGDRLRMSAVLKVRAVQRRSVEVWSASTYRTRPLACPPPAIGSITEVPGADDMPASLVVPRELPKHGSMGPRYVLPYYYGAGVLFGALERAGLDPKTPFRPDHPSLRALGSSPEGWGNLQEDATFGRMRLQGPNPWWLRSTGDGAFEVDYRPAFAGVAPAVVCRFEAHGDELAPTVITVDGAQHRPGRPGWRRAKLLANALDARLTVFGDHLGTTHLAVAQAFALARFELPIDHGLRSFADLHGFATLQVNDFAYKLLISPSSYFVRSGFVGRAQVARLFHNLVPRIDAQRLLPERDLERRGLEAIADHPYATEARATWPVLRRYAGSVVDAVYDGDVELASDPALAAWDGRLRALLPRPAAALLPRPTSRAALAELLAAWVYNNVVHEICGDFSPYVSGCDDEQAQLVDFDRLRMGMEAGPASLAGVFLMKQGAAAGLFDTRGNSMLRVHPAKVTTNPAHAAALRDLQAALRTLSTEVRARNAARAVPFLRMDPAKWELSIGF